MHGLWSHPARPWAAPMVLFLLWLTLGDFLGLGRWEFPFRVVVMAAAIWICSREVVSLRAPDWLGSIAIGVAVFFIWVGPDMLFPGYRDHWLFQNSLTGKVVSSYPKELTSDWMALAFRTIRAAVIVPIVEELFWRGFLMRYLIDPDFLKVPLGQYGRQAFWITAALFAAEHGPYWDVGLICGVIYNWWMVRTKSLGNCILMHAVTNLVLSAFVIGSGRWEYW